MRDMAEFVLNLASASSMLLSEAYRRANFLLRAICAAD
jgi:hypothetical protein